MKIKSFPQDFQVEERISLPLLSQGAYGVYRLRKRELTTLEALRRLGNYCEVPPAEIRYGGKKDRQGETVQFLTVPASRNLVWKDEKLSCDFWGYSEEPMGPLWIRENFFRMVLRDISSLEEAQKISEKAEEISRKGMPNYYDDQRFGAQANSKEFFAEKLLQQNPSEALRLYFTEMHPDAPGRVRRRSAFISRNWGDWRKIYPFCTKATHRKILGILRRENSMQNFWKGVNVLPGEIIGLYISSFQSFLWNRLLEKYLFPDSANSRLRYLNCGPWKFAGAFSGKAPLVFPEPRMIASHAAEVPFIEKDLLKLWMEVLEERGLLPEFFTLPELQKAYFGSFFRPSLVFPGELTCLEDPGKKEKDFRITLSFTLPRGSYATLFIKLIGVLCQ